MTKHDWKYGDVGVYRGIYSHMSHLINSKVRVTQIVVPFGLVNVQFPDGSIYTVDPESLSPAESPKDPFAPGEYVTCFREEEGQHRKIGDVVKVRTAANYLPGDCFSYEPFDMERNAKRESFRPATPEEIAAYKAKYEAKEPKLISASDADLSITAPDCAFGEKGQTKPRITFTVGGQEFYVGQRVWASMDYDFIKPNMEIEVTGTISGYYVVVRKIGSWESTTLPLSAISTTPPTPHEWKRGDWARHEIFGVGFVYRVVKDAVPGGVFVSFEDQIPAAFKPEVLTFISHSEPPE